jgi:hypothetical protein
MIPVFKPQFLNCHPASLRQLARPPTRALEPIGPVLNSPVPNLYVRPIAACQAGA